MKKIYCIILLSFICLNSYGQSLVKIKRMFLQADSVILTSHSYSGVINDNEDPNDRKLVLNGSINSKFIKEQKRITDSSVKYLATFITRPFQDKTIEESCFNPHHTIYIFKGKTISYIDICFGCQEILCSEDINFPEEDFDRATWKKLEKFFRLQQFKYGFDIDDP